MTDRNYRKGLKKNTQQKIKYKYGKKTSFYFSQHQSRFFCNVMKNMEAR